MASRKIEDLHPAILPLYNAFKNAMKAAGVEFITTCTYRSPEEQDSLYALGRTFQNGIWTTTDSKKVVTWVRAGGSAHNVRIDGKPAALAFDIGILTAGKLNWDGRHQDWTTARKIGAEVGLNNLHPKESAHFEFPDWKKVGLIKKTP